MPLFQHPDIGTFEVDPQDVEQVKQVDGVQPADSTITVETSDIAPKDDAESNTEFVRRVIGAEVPDEKKLGAIQRQYKLSDSDAKMFWIDADKKVGLHQNGLMQLGKDLDQQVIENTVAKSIAGYKPKQEQAEASNAVLPPVGESKPRAAAGEIAPVPAPTEKADEPQEPKHRARVPEEETKPLPAISAAKALPSIKPIAAEPESVPQELLQEHGRYSKPSVLPPVVSQEMTGMPLAAIAPEESDRLRRKKATRII